MVALLLVLGATSAFAGPQLWNLGAGKSTGMISTGGIVAYNSGASAKLWNQGASYTLAAAGFTAGVAMKGSTVVVAGGTVSTTPGYSGVAKRWDGNASGVGSWTNLPQDGGCDWTPMCIGASATDVSIGGSCLWDNVWYGDRYQESKNQTWEGVRPNDNYDNPSFVYGITATNAIAAQAIYVGGGGTERGAIGSNGGDPNPSLGLNALYGAPTNQGFSAMAIAADGSRIAGWSWVAGAAANQACYWDAPFTAGESPVAIPLLSGYYWARAFGVSSDGAYVVGSCYRQSDDALAGWVWDSVNGTRNLADVLTAAGIDLTGWTLAVSDGFQMGPTAVSSDGKWFCGTGRKDGVVSAYVAFIPEPSSLSVLALGLLGLLKLRRRS